MLSVYLSVYLSVCLSVSQCHHRSGAWWTFNLSHSFWSLANILSLLVSILKLSRKVLIWPPLACLPRPWILPQRLGSSIAFFLIVCPRNFVCLILIVWSYSLFMLTLQSLEVHWINIAECGMLNIECNYWILDQQKYITTLTLRLLKVLK